MKVEMSTDFPRDFENPSQEYLDIEKNFKGDREHITDEQTLAMMLFKGFRLTRNEFSTCVAKDLVINCDDTDDSYEKFMAKWTETEKQFGYFGKVKK